MTEREKYHLEIALLESTEGYQKLSPRQQQIIRVTLYLQERAERDMNPDHKNDPWYYDWYRREQQHKPKYQDSLEHIKKWYCHVAVNAVEMGKMTDSHPEDCSLNFFDGQYFLVQNEIEIKTVLELFGFPTVVHIGGEENNEGGEESKVHTFLALGHDKEGNIVAWEKIRIDEPYRLSTISKIFLDYGPGWFWGVRHLR